MASSDDASADPDPRAEEFVRESEASSGREGNDPTRHLAVLRAMQAKAVHGELLDVDDLRGWYRELSAGAGPDRDAPRWDRVQDLLDALAGQLRPQLARCPPGPGDLMARMDRRPSDPAQIASWAAEVYWTGRDAGLPGELLRLLVAYVALFCAAPLIVFRASEQTALEAAARSGLDAVRVYMADKLQEAVYHPSGAVIERAAQYTETSFYGESGSAGLTVDWSELHSAQRAWKRAAGWIL